MHLYRFCNVHPCASQGSSQSQLKITTFGTLSLGDAVILTLSSTSSSFLRKKRNFGALRCRAASRWPFLDGNHDQQAGMLPRPPLAPKHTSPTFFFPGIIALVHGCPHRSTSLWVSVPSSKGMPHTRVWHRSVACHAISTAAGSSSCRLLSPMSGRMCRWRLTLLHEGARQDKQQLCRCAAFRLPVLLLLVVDPELAESLC